MDETVLDPTTFEPCIQCEQRSKVFATMPSGLDVTLCGHHGTVHLDALIEQGAFIVWDLREYDG